jgi:hypothetical protein
MNEIEQAASLSSSQASSGGSISKMGMAPTGSMITTT